MSARSIVFFLALFVHLFVCLSIRSFVCWFANFPVSASAGQTGEQLPLMTTNVALMSRRRSHSRPARIRIQLAISCSLLGLCFNLLESCSTTASNFFYLLANGGGSTFQPEARRPRRWEARSEQNWRGQRILCVIRSSWFNCLLIQVNCWSLAGELPKSEGLAVSNILIWSARYASQEREFHLDHIF